MKTSRPNAHAGTAIPSLIHEWKTQNEEKNPRNAALSKAPCHIVANGDLSPHDMPSDMGSYPRCSNDQK
eukprot:4125212-Amphidinium_carterae.1